MDYLAQKQYKVFRFAGQNVGRVDSVMLYVLIYSRPKQKTSAIQPARMIL